MNLHWDIGSHITYKGNISKTFEKSIEYGMYTFQFFLGNPKSFTRARLTQDDINSAKKLNHRFPTHVISHAPYLYNLCGSKDVLAWNGDKKQDDKLTYNLKELEHELEVLSNFTEKSNGVVIHPGNYTNRTIGLKTIGTSINKINFPANSKLLLENSAGQGTSLATTLEEINTIISYVDKKEHIGVCIDTCHLYAVGDYDISKVSEVQRMFQDFDKIIGLNKLSLIHLNDSQTKLGSRKDRHEYIGQGYIWKDSTESLIYLLEKCKTLNIPIVLETDPSDMATINMLADKLTTV